MLTGLRFAVLVTSDRASAGQRKDDAGPRLQDSIVRYGGNCVATTVIPDEEEIIREKMIALCERNDVDILITTGGTGVSPRDVTVDVTLSVIEKEIPGFGEEMRRRSLELTPNAILSRATAGILKGTFILNLPGNPQGAVDCLGWVMKPLPHLVDLLHNKVTDCSNNKNGAAR